MAEVVLGLLAIIVLALVAAGGWYCLKQRGLASGTLAESSTPQGFDNITFRDVRPGRRASLPAPASAGAAFVLKAQQIPAGCPRARLGQRNTGVQRALPLIGLRAKE